MLMLANQLIMTLSMAHFQKHLSVLYIYVVSDVLCNTSGSLAAGEQSGDPDSQSCTIYPDIIKNHNIAKCNIQMSAAAVF